MLKLSGVFKSKNIWSVRYGFMGCDESDEWSFGGPEDELSVWVPDDEWSVLVTDIDWISLDSTLYTP